MFVLDELLGESLGAASSSISTAEGLRDFLSRRCEVFDLRSALATGGLVIQDIERFVQELLHDFRPNEKFPADYALASIATALESFPGNFATTFLSELASICIREMPLAPRVARLCMAQREASLSEATWRERTLEQPEMPQSGQPIEEKPIRVQAGLNDREYQSAA